MYKELENEIIEKLSADIRELAKVVPYPADYTASGKTFVQSTVLVSLKSDSLQKPINPFSCVSALKGTANFEIMIMSKNLRTHTGVYTLAELVRDSLANFRPTVPNTSRLYFTGFEFDQYDADGFWIYTLQCGIDYSVAYCC